MSAPMYKLRGKKQTNNKITLPQQQKQYKRPIWVQKMGRERKLISFIKNQSETAIVKQLY